MNECIVAQFFDCCVVVVVVVASVAAAAAVVVAAVVSGWCISCTVTCAGCCSNRWRAYLGSW